MASMWYHHMLQILYIMQPWRGAAQEKANHGGNKNNKPDAGQFLMEAAPRCTDVQAQITSRRRTETISSQT